MLEHDALLMDWIGGVEDVLYQYKLWNECLSMLIVAYGLFCSNKDNGPWITSILTCNCPGYACAYKGARNPIGMS